MTDNERAETCQRLIQYAQATEAVMSLLYDLDLMPEQVTAGTHEYWKMISVITHFVEAQRAQDAELARLRAIEAKAREILREYEKGATHVAAWCKPPKLCLSCAIPLILAAGGIK